MAAPVGQSAVNKTSEVWTMKKHNLKLLGNAGGGVRIAADVLAEALQALIEGAQRATRLYVEGESLRKGPRPGWLEATSHIEVTGLRPGSVEVAIEVPTLQEAAPSRFSTEAQPLLFGEPSRRLDVNQTGVEIFAEVLSRASAETGDDLLADRSLLDSCIRFARVPGPHFTGISLEGLATFRAPVTVRKEDIERLERLRDETPPACAVRVSGILDTISVSRPDIILRLPDGSSVPARLDQPEGDHLRQLFGKPVVISGVAKYRPSGRLLVIDVEDIALATDADAIWAKSPRPGGRRSAPVVSLLPQDSESGVSAFFGIWPGSESDEELLQALRDAE